MKRRARVLRVGVLLLALGLVLSACSSSKPARLAANPAGVCHWPSTSDPAASGLAVTESDREIVSYDVQTGAIVGECVTTIAKNERVPVFLLNGVLVRHDPQEIQSIPLTGGPHIDVIPYNNGSTGGIRDLHTGLIHHLKFDGWIVVIAVGNQLVLAHGSDDTYYPTSPSDWCVLPTYNSPKADCTPISGASSDGIPSVSPTGDVRWSPLEAEPVALGSLNCYAAGNGVDSIYAITSSSDPNFYLVSRGRIGADQRTVQIFLSMTSPKSLTIQWARINFANGVMTGQVFDSGLTLDFNNEDEVDMGEAGFESSSDGRTLIALQDDGTVTELNTAGTYTRIATLNRPPDTSDTGNQILAIWPESALTENT